MQDEEILTPAEQELASVLGGLVPAAAGIDRDRMMFQAGRASARRRGYVWQGATAALAFALGLSVITLPAPRQIERLVYVTKEVPGLPGEQWASTGSPRRESGSSKIEGSYLELRNEVLAHGLDALSAFYVRAGRSGKASESLEESPDVPEQAPYWRAYPGARALEKLGGLL